MDAEGKAKFLAVYERMQEGYRFLEEERKQRIRKTRTIDIIEQYDAAFELVRQEPLRQTSGLVEFYKILSRTRK